MGRKSTKENKTIYQIFREDLSLTREKASDLMEYISSDRIEKIESKKSSVHPDEVVVMAKCYKRPELFNYYCSHECPIGQQYVPEIQMKDLSQIVLETVASLNTLDKDKNRLIEIAVDGKITQDEYEDFTKIKQHLAQISLAIDTMQLWLDKAIADGDIDKDALP